MERIKELVSGYFMSLDDLINTLKDAGYEVEDATFEDVTAWGETEDGDDVLYTIKIDWLRETLLTKDVTEKVFA